MKKNEMKKINSLQDLINTEDAEIILTSKAMDELYDGFGISLIVGRSNMNSGIFKQFFVGLFSSVTAQSSMGSVSYADIKNELKVNRVKNKSEANEEICRILSSGTLYDLMDKTILFKK